MWANRFAFSRTSCSNSFGASGIESRCARMAGEARIAAIESAKNIPRGVGRIDVTHHVEQPGLAGAR